MLYFYIGIAFLANCFILYLLFSLIFKSKINVQERLQNIEEMYREDLDLEDIRKLPFKQRIINPLNTKIKTFMQSITPRERRNELEKNLRLANYPYGLGVNGWIILKLLFYTVLPIILIYIIILGTNTIFIKIMLSIIVLTICFVFPDAMIKGRISKRSKKLVLQLPDILDLLTVSVEAGLSFDSAMGKVTEKAKGELVSEFDLVLNEIQLGKTRRDALMDMSKRCNVSEINAFIFSVVQGEKMGVSIAKVLRIQAAQARDKRKQRAREQAMKAPVKILIPLALFIFPTIFVILLGPAVIQIFEHFVEG